jgi:CBS domain containing-hemolysin-like protein
VNGLSQSIQKTVSDYKNGASDLRDNIEIVNTVQLIKYASSVKPLFSIAILTSLPLSHHRWIIEIVVCAFLVFASLAGLIAGVWPKRTFFLMYDFSLTQHTSALLVLTSLSPSAV